MLTEDAVEHGIQSTTRFRKQANGKRTGGLDLPPTQRQRSSVKGGRAAKTIVVRHRNEDTRREQYRQRSLSRRFQQQQRPYPEAPYAPYATGASQFHVPVVAPASSMGEFGLRSVVGCAEVPACLPLFSDLTPWAGADLLASFDRGVWCSPHLVPNGCF